MRNYARRWRGCGRRWPSCVRTLPRLGQWRRSLTGTLRRSRVGQAGIVAALNALRETQVEQGRVLGEHGRVLGSLVVTQQQQTEVLARHTAALDGLTAAVGALADGQDRQAGTLAEILRRLPG